MLQISFWVCLPLWSVKDGEQPHPAVPFALPDFRRNRHSSNKLTEPNLYPRFFIADTLGTGSQILKKVYIGQNTVAIEVNMKASNISDCISSLKGLQEKPWVHSRHIVMMCYQALRSTNPCKMCIPEASALHFTIYSSLKWPPQFTCVWNNYQITMESSLATVTCAPQFYLWVHPCLHIWEKQHRCALKTGITGNLQIFVPDAQRLCNETFSMYTMARVKVNFHL